MIDLHSAALYQVMHDPDHGRVILALLDAGMEFRDIIDALICDGDVLTTMLLAFTRSLQRAGGELSGPELLSDDGQRMPICRPAQASAHALRDLRSAARHARKRGLAMDRREAVNAFAAVRGDAVVITGPGMSSGMLWEANPHPATPREIASHNRIGSHDRL